MHTDTPIYAQNERRRTGVDDTWKEKLLRYVVGFCTEAVCGVEEENLEWIHGVLARKEGMNFMAKFESLACALWHYRISKRG